MFAKDQSGVKPPHSKSLQLLVFFLRFNQRRNIVVRIFPERKEVEMVSLIFIWFIGSMNH